MKKIVFCLQKMSLGGVEKELISVLKQIHNKYDITVLLLHYDDMEILKEIPGDVKVEVVGIDKDYYYGSCAQLMRQRLKKGQFLQALSLGLKRCFRTGMTGANTNLRDIPVIEDSFDVAVCYHIHSPLMMKYVVEKINASKKVGWIHNDFYASGFPVQRLKKYVSMYDEFVAVSKKVENEFRALCPWYKGGISTAYNYLDDKEIIGLSESSIDDKLFLDEKEIKLLTVGRFTEQKGIDMAIYVASMLKKARLKFHWFVIGYGELEATYHQLIEKYDVADCFTILGRKSNPYPYIRNGDIYVQPSRHEAFPLVIMEAKILNKPIVCTNYDGADEQIDNGKNGVIVPLNDTSALFDAIEKLICNPEIREALSLELGKTSAEDALQEIEKHFQ